MLPGEKEQNAAGNLEFSISEDEVAAAVRDVDFEKAGSVKMSDDVDYIEFSTEELVSRLRPFVQKKAVSRDIITRSLKVVPDKDAVFLYATDAISYLECKIAAKINKFPGEVIVNTESLSLVTHTHKTKSYLIHRAGKVYSNFYGGEVFIDTFKLSPTLYQTNLGPEKSRSDLNPSALKNVLQSFSAVVASTEVADLAYIFIDQDGAFACNGTLVSKITTVLPTVVIRQTDINLISYLIDSVPNEKFSLAEYENFYSLDAETFSYTFPKVNGKLSADYKKVVVKPDSEYFVNLPYLSSILSVLTQMPESSGVIDLEFGDELKGISKNRKGDESSFVISTSRKGDSLKQKFGVSNKALTIAMRVFKGSASVSISYKDGKVLLSTDNKECVIVLKR